MLKIKWADRIMNDEVCQRAKEERLLLKMLKNIRLLWIGHTIRHNEFVVNTLEGEISGEKAVGRPRLQYLEQVARNAGADSYTAMKKIKKGKVKCTLVQALRLCTGRTAHRGSRDIALFFLDHGTSRGEGPATRPGRPSPPGKDPALIVQEAGWAPGSVWSGAENLAPTRIRSPDRPARSQSLYRLLYPARNEKNGLQQFQMESCQPIERLKGKKKKNNNEERPLGC